MRSTSRGERLQRAVALTTAAVLVAFGIAAVVKGLDGRSTVSGALEQEHIEGEPFMTPRGIAARASAAGLRGVDLPDCSVAGKAITGGDSARCFAEYMRIDALMVTGGKTYSQMPAFIAQDGKLTSDFAQAKKLPSGAPVGNPARQSWVTETALATALNTSYMAEQISLFGIGVGAVMLLLGLLIGGLALAGGRMSSADGQAQARRAETLSRT